MEEKRQHKGASAPFFWRQKKRIPRKSPACSADGVQQKGPPMGAEGITSTQ